jgi:hypothetical protein
MTVERPRAIQRQVAVTTDDAVARRPAVSSPNGVQEVGEQSDTENDCRDPGHFDEGNPVKWHAPSLAAVE